MSKKRVLVVDDSAFMRSVITRHVEKDDRLELLDVARDGVEAVEKACALKPDVMTLDIEMPHKNGLEALTEIMEKCPTRVVMVSSLTKEGAEETMKALELGAVDFLPKAMDDSQKSIFSQGKVLQDKIYTAATSANLTQKITEPDAGSVRTSRSDAEIAPERHAKPQPNSQLRFKNAEVALIGISTGGPKALHGILPHMPDRLRVPLIIVQHMPPNFTAAMAERLDRICKLTVREIENNMPLEANHVYIVPGGKQCTVTEKAGKKNFIVRDDDSATIYKPSVEVVAESLHNVYGGRVLAVMMTGMGSDGIKGFAALKQAGAYVIAQDEATCVVYGMPKAVVEKGLSNEVLPLDEIPDTIERLLS